jgi:hypothetical protein
VGDKTASALMCCVTSLLQIDRHSRAAAFSSQSNIVIPHLNSQSVFCRQTNICLFFSRSIPVFAADSSPSSPSPAAIDADDADYITCFATSCADLGDNSGLSDIVFIGTKSGDVISHCIRDVAPASTSQKHQKRRSSMRVVGSIAILGANLNSSSPNSSADAAAAGCSRVMVCQRSICAIAASSR